MVVDHTNIKPEIRISLSAVNDYQNIIQEHFEEYYKGHKESFKNFISGDYFLNLRSEADRAGLLDFFSFLKKSIPL